ncbi:RlpA-like double-psi beta-barrel-protein domain-containing protein-containing protein [Mycena floridula]|nr:RlpA-like double-psi beta-barrel-protein domain-containing protein-containing protein [Mycena floridula]
MVPFLNKFLTLLGLFCSSVLADSDWIDYAPDGIATMTHYDMPRDYIASCGCTSTSTHFPTAALSQMAYGSSNSYGPSCGRCFKLTLLNTFLSDPPYYPDVTKSIIVKITDLCPLSDTGWCSGSRTKTNQAGAQLNFDLSFPSQAIPSDFFPSDAELYGYTDFGVWNISYQSVDCQQWAGYSNPAALGSLADSGGCCPSNPTNANNTCPSYSDNNGIPPDTTTTSSGISAEFNGNTILTIPLLHVLISSAVMFWLCN